MKKWFNKFILIIILGYFSFYIGKSIYFYYFDKSFPIVNLIGINDNGYYSGVLKFNIDGSDEYKIKNFSVMLDEKIIVNKNRINSSSFSYPISIPTFSLENGEHELKVIVLDSAKKTNTTEKNIKFNVDNIPLEVNLIKKENEIKVLQGNTLHLNFQSNKTGLKAYANTLSYKVPCVLESNRSKIYECFIPISTDEIPNEYLLTINFEDNVGNKAIIETTYQVISQNFKKEQISIGKKLDLESRTNDDLRERIKECTLNSPNKKLWNGKFYAPCLFKAQTTSFGVIRTSMERGKYRHDAIDFSATPRSPVWACQDGMVVIKDNFIYTGNTVVIDHGCGILSLYAHLDSFAPIEVGQFIKRGNILGTVGMTGYATGYHLHWEIRICNVPINPMEWIKEDI